MKKTLIAAAMALSGLNVSAATLFSTFPDQGYGGNWLGNGGAGSQEFILASASTITSMSISEWRYGADPNGANITWTISSGAKGAGSIASGVASASSVANVTSPWIYTTSFALPSVALAAGHYYVTLASDTSGGDFWGLTTAYTGMNSYDFDPNSLTWYDTSTSYQFILSVDGTAGPAQVPEPAISAMLLLGLGLMAGATRRKRN